MTAQAEHQHSTQQGIILVLLSALVWSSGGAISRAIGVDDQWAVVAWRSFFAALFLLAFLLWRDGFKGTVQAFRSMGWSGFGVAICFAISTTCFVMAISYTTVANVLLIQAAAPIIAAFMSWLLFKEQVPVATWLAIIGVVLGVVIMVSDSLGNQMSLVGNVFALALAFSFATATVITRRYAHVRMTPAVATGVSMSGVLAAFMASTLVVSMPDLGWLMAFGALNLGLGLALFVTGARLIPAALAALLSTLEPVLGPVWVWLFHHEVPSHMTIIGGIIILIALVSNIMWQYYHQRCNPK
jgi:drug/metabolite transporter (DMT)-like permease